LQILTALIEKAPRDLPLYAPYVLKILNLILKSRDITMVEASIPTFEAFCEHHDGATLSADQDYLRQYEEIIQLYASFASTQPQPAKVQPSAPVAMRWRSVGLQAVKSIADSEALASVAGRQLNVIVPALLENVWTENAEYLEALHHRMREEEAVDSEKALRRRTSVATVRTKDTSEANPAALSGSTADADRAAEELIGILALQCLKQIFVVNNRSQIRGATQVILTFIAERVKDQQPILQTNPNTGNDSGWATTIFEMITRWTPVQDRYVILVTAMETLVKSPLVESNMEQQLVLATMVGSLLRSDINLIGLSVMDVLLGLIQHVLRILQLGGIGPHLQQKDVTGDEKYSVRDASKEPSPSTSVSGNAMTEVAVIPSAPRKDLLIRLQKCIGDLATHVYYADQIPDMITAILLRLKPSPLSSVPTAAAAIEDPEAATTVLASSGNLLEDPNTDVFFSFDTAKVTALKAIKDIILVASRGAKLSGGGSLSRNRVGTQVWEGTQWLLRDGNWRVRTAYVDALLSWLEREMLKSDLLAFEDKQLGIRGPKLREDSTGNLSKRVLSNITHRDKPNKIAKSTFLQLLHLAIYENALQYVDSEADIVLLHLLLTTLVNKLGVNAVKSGLPMILHLQEEIQEVESPIAKVRLGALCHGYFWAISQKFDFESSEVGQQIESEITRRRSKALWVDRIILPPLSLANIEAPGQDGATSAVSRLDPESESLTPFDNKTGLVECIAVAYASSTISPPVSPPSSPGHSFSYPILGGPNEDVASENDLPAPIKDEMLSEWNKDSVLATVQDSSKTASLNGSRAGTAAGTPRNFLAVNGNLNYGTNSGTQSPHHPHSSRSRPPSQAYGLVGNIGALHKLRKGSAQEGSPTPVSDSSRGSVTRVDHLKQVLSGQQPGSAGTAADFSDASSDSMVSYDFSLSEVSVNHRAVSGAGTSGRDSAEVPRSSSHDRPSRASESSENFRPLGSHPINNKNEITLTEYLENESEAKDTVPPVPQLPAHLAGAAHSSNNAQPDITPGSSGQNSDVGRSRSMRRGSSRRSDRGSSWGSSAHGMDLESLLKGISSGGDQKGLLGKGQPPY
jgi:hypothetical protein